jgi:ankyrin repeat protein
MGKERYSSCCERWGCGPDILSIDADLSILDQTTGQTPLHIAVEQDNPVVLKMLLDARANTSVYNSWNKTPLIQFEGETNNMAIVETPLEAGAELSVATGQDSLLVIAIEKQNRVIVKMLLDTNAASGYDIQTPLVLLRKVTWPYLSCY